MENQVLKLDQSVKAYQRLAKSRMQSGDYEGALWVLLDLKKRTRNKDVIKDIAEAYYSLGLYELSAKQWFKYLSCTNKVYHAEAYEGLGNCYFYLSNFSVSSYYFNKCVQLGGKMVELSPEMYESISNFLENDSEDNPTFEFVHPPRAVDCTKLLFKAKRKMLEGNLSEAIKLYSEVAKGNPSYEEARTQLAVAYFMKGEVDYAITIAKDIVSTINEKSVYALCTLCTMCSYKGDTEQSGYFYRKLKDEYAQGNDDHYKIATCALEKNDYERAKKHLDAILKDKPYEKNVNFIYAMIDYNQGNRQLALDRLAKILSINGEDTVYQYYYDYIKSRDGEKTKKPLEYFYRLPKEEEKRRYKVLKDILDKKDGSSAIKKIRQNYDLISWCLEQYDLKYQHTGAYLLAVLGDIFAESRFLDLLLDPTIFDEVKEYIIKILALQGFSKTVGIVISNVYKSVVFRDIDIDDCDFSAPFIEAYAKGFAYISVYTDYDAKKFRETVLEGYALYSGRIDLSIFSIETLSAVFYLKSGYEDFSSIEEIAKDFDTDTKSISALINYMENL